MLGDIDFLMTDEFAQFAEAIKAIKTTKEEKTETMKQLYAAFQEEIEDLDKQAADLYEAFKAKQATAEKPE